MNMEGPRDPELKLKNETIHRQHSKKFGKHVLVDTENFNKVVFSRIRGLMVTVAEPIVKRIEGTNIYAIFGASHIENLNDQAREAVKQTESHGNQNEIEQPGADEEDENDEEEDSEGVEEKDIELVVNQANVSRNKAIKALKKNNNDIVNAIMELTS